MISKKEFYQKNNLPPVDFVIFPEKAMYPLRNINAQEKSGEGNEIMKRCLPLALGQILTEQNNITGLCIGKDFAAAVIGIGVLKTAGQS